MVRKGSGITINYESKEKVNDLDCKSSVVIAELEMGTERSFQFNTQLETDEETEEIEINSNPRISSSSHTASAEFIFVEELPKDGEIVEIESY